MEFEGQITTLKDIKIGGIYIVSYKPKQEDFIKYNVKYHWSAAQEATLYLSFTITRINSDGVYKGFVYNDNIGVPFFCLKEKTKLSNWEKVNW